MRLHRPLIVGFLTVFSCVLLAGPEPHKMQELSDLPQPDAEALRTLAGKFMKAVNQRSVPALQALIHPDILESLSTNQLSCLQGVYLASRFHHTIADVYSLRFAEMDKEELQELEERWHAQWNPSPKLLVELSYDRGPDKGTILPLYVASKGDEWYLLTPIPPEGLVSKYLEIKRTANQHKRSSNKPNGE